jgi:hypothetical protein
VLGNTGTLASSKFNGKYDGLSFGNLGLALTYAGFTIGGNVIGGRMNGPLAATPQLGAGELAYTVGLKYVSGAFTIGAAGEIGWYQGNVRPWPDGFGQMRKPDLSAEPPQQRGLADQHNLYSARNGKNGSPITQPMASRRNRSNQFSYSTAPRKSPMSGKPDQFPQQKVHLISLAVECSIRSIRMSRQSCTQNLSRASHEFEAERYCSLPCLSSSYYCHRAAVHRIR